MTRFAFLLAFSAASFAAERFPKPDPESTFRELKIYVGGSPVRAAREDWDSARKRAAEDPEWRRWLTGRRAEIDEWIAKRRDRVEWIAGWHHDFVSPKDGSFLNWTPDVPGRYLSSPSDPQVEVTPTLFSAWVFRFRSQHMARMEEAAALFRLTGEEKYADWVAGQIDFYAGNYEKWPVQTRLSKSRVMAQSLDEAVNLIKLVNAARYIWPRVPEAQKQRWRETLFAPEAALLDETFQRIHNIACWQRTAQAHVALLYADEALWKRAIDGEYGIRRQIAEGVTGDYLWFEQSLGYNSYVVSALLPLFTYASLEGRADSLHREMAIAQNLMLSPIMMRFPGGQLPNPADTTGGPGRAPNEAILAAAYRLFPTPLGVAAAGGQRNWNTLLDPPTPAGERELPEVRSWNMESSRMAILRKGPWQVFFHYGQLDRSHAQAEALNYEVFHCGMSLTHDPGTVGYGSPLHRGYYTTALAHNVPVVDRVGQEGWDPGELLTFDVAAGRVSAAQPRYRKDASARRELTIDGSRLVDVVEIKAGAPRKLGFVLHFDSAVRIAGTEPGGDVPHWTEMRTGVFEDRVVFETKPLRVTVEAPGRLSVITGSAPDTPPHRNHAALIETTGTEAKFRVTWEMTTTCTSPR